MQFSDNSLDLVLQKQSYEKFLIAKKEDRDLYREDVEILLKDLIEKENSEAGEIYIVARQLKNSNEFMLANMAYKAIYDRYKEDLDGNIIAEYAQTLFLSQGRKFNNDIDNILDDALTKNPLNPSALTLKGLSELEKNNPDLTVEYWNKTLPLFGSQKEKTELIGLIEAVKKRKNQ
jgi:cytochrome c-type biogenesis protein CcmH/NrfG